MRAAVPTVRTARRIACLVGLASAALACQSPSGVRYRVLADDLERVDARAVRPPGVADDPFAGVPTLARRPLVEAVLERNPNLAVARQTYRGALARYPQATALDDPMLGLGVAPLSFGARGVDAAGRIDLSQRLPFPGKRRLRGEAALAEAEAAGQDLESLRLELAALASRLFDDYALSARALEINQEHAALLGELHRLSLARYAAGEDSKQAVLQAEMALARAQVERGELESRAALVVEQINALLHRGIALPLPEAPRALAIPADPSDPVDGLVAEAVDAHPVLAAADARLHAADARVGLARREFMPDFTLTGAYDRLWQESALQPFVGVQLNVPLALGRRRAALAESEADFEGSRHRRIAVEDDVRLGVESASTRLAQARRAELLIRDRLLPAATEQVAAARSGYAAGSSTVLVLIEALRELHEIELGHQSALAEIARLRAELDRALGRIPGITW